MRIEKDGILYAIIHRKDDWSDGLNFLTPDYMYLQVGTFLYEKGKILKAHRHVTNIRSTILTQECLFVLEGSLRIDLYDDKELFRSEIINSGDIVIMAEGGHGFEMLEDKTKVLECKNGPFISVEKDKKLI